MLIFALFVAAVCDTCTDTSFEFACARVFGCVWANSLSTPICRNESQFGGYYEVVDEDPSTSTGVVGYIHSTSGKYVKYPKDGIVETPRYYQPGMVVYDYCALNFAGYVNSEASDDVKCPREYCDFFSMNGNGDVHGCFQRVDNKECEEAFSDYCTVLPQCVAVGENCTHEVECFYQFEATGFCDANLDCENDATSGRCYKTGVAGCSPPKTVNNVLQCDGSICKVHQKSDKAVCMTDQDYCDNTPYDMNCYSGCVSFETCCSEVTGPSCVAYCHANPSDINCYPTCVGNASYDICCDLGPDACNGYCTTYPNDIDCYPFCAATPSFAVCCASPSSASCGAYCALHPEDIQCYPSCNSSPSYGVCCGLGVSACTAYCAVNPSDLSCLCASQTPSYTSCCAQSTVACDSYCASASDVNCPVACNTFSDCCNANPNGAACTGYCVGKTSGDCNDVAICTASIAGSKRNVTACGCGALGPTGGHTYGDCCSADMLEPKCVEFCEYEGNVNSDVDCLSRAACLADPELCGKEPSAGSVVCVSRRVLVVGILSFLVFLAKM